MTTEASSGNNGQTHGRLATLEADVAHIRQSVDRLSLMMDEITRLQASASHHSEALARAFTRIERVERTQEQNERAHYEISLRMEKEESMRKTYLWVGGAFLSGVTIMWAVVAVILKSGLGAILETLARVQ